MTGRDTTGRDTTGREATGSERILDPRAVRVEPAGAAALAGIEAIVIEPGALPVVPSGPPDGSIAGSPGAFAEPAGSMPEPAGPEAVVIDGRPAAVRLDRLGATHAVLVEDGDAGTVRTRLLILDGPGGGGAASAGGVVRREVVVDGWAVEVAVESAARAALRRRATRDRAAAGTGGPTQVRAIIPGRIVSVAVTPGDEVVAGQRLLVVEAMKMQNELRAPRDGTVSEVAAGEGRTVEVGDLLVVLA